VSLLLPGEKKRTNTFRVDAAKYGQCYYDAQHKLAGGELTHSVVLLQDLFFLADMVGDSDGRAPKELAFARVTWGTTNNRADTKTGCLSYTFSKPGNEEARRRQEALGRHSIMRLADLGESAHMGTVRSG
jgi:hypothetical protein